MSHFQGFSRFSKSIILFIIERKSYHSTPDFANVFMMQSKKNIDSDNKQISRGGSRTAATSKMERFVIIVNGFQPLTIITKHSILVVAAALDPPLD